MLSTVEALGNSLEGPVVGERTLRPVPDLPTQEQRCLLQQALTSKVGTPQSFGPPRELLTGTA